MGLGGSRGGRRPGAWFKKGYKWQGLSNGGKNKKSKKSLDLNSPPPPPPKKKKPMSNFRALKISRKLDITRKIKFLITSLVVLYSQNHTTGIRGHYYESSDCFEYPKKSLLKSRHPKKLANISYPKNPRNRKFQTPKNPRYPPPPGGRSHPHSSRERLRPR